MVKLGMTTTIDPIQLDRCGNGIYSFDKCIADGKICIILALSITGVKNPSDHPCFRFFKNGNPLPDLKMNLLLPALKDDIYEFPEEKGVVVGKGWGIMVDGGGDNLKLEAYVDYIK